MLLFKPLTNEDVKERIFPKIEKIVKELKGVTMHVEKEVK